MGVSGHQFFYLTQFRNFASSAAHNTPPSPALLEQPRELVTLTYVHGKCSWRGERWGGSKKEVTATQIGFLFYYLYFYPLTPPPISFPHPYPFPFKLVKIPSTREEGIKIQVLFAQPTRTGVMPEAPPIF